MWGATAHIVVLLQHFLISIHAPRVGSDFQKIAQDYSQNNFNPRSPCGERRRRSQSRCPGDRYFNPRSPCGERPTANVVGPLHVLISIHAPRVGSDGGPLTSRCTRLISIHAPRVGSDLNGGTVDLSLTEFQSTLPVWGATSNLQQLYQAAGISIHAPRVGSDDDRFVVHGLLKISIHAPRVGSDTRGPMISILFARFQSTLPVWGATPSPIRGSLSAVISIHAPRVGSDGGQQEQRGVTHISIHAPRVGSDLYGGQRG